LLIDLGTLGLTLDNLEALALGATLPSGSRTLVIASHNNFDAIQVKQFLAFDLGVVSSSNAAALLAIGGLAAARRGRA